MAYCTSSCDERSDPRWIANEPPACYAHRNHIGPTMAQIGKEPMLSHERYQQRTPHESTGRCHVQAQCVHRVRHCFPIRC